VKGHARGWGGVGWGGVGGLLVSKILTMPPMPVLLPCCLSAQIMESLGGDALWFDRFVAEHSAIVYYWGLVLMYMLSPKDAYAFSELVEWHATDTYTQVRRVGRFWGFSVLGCGRLLSGCNKHIAISCAMYSFCG